MSPLIYRFFLYSLFSTRNKALPTLLRVNNSITEAYIIISNITSFLFLHRRPAKHVMSQGVMLECFVKCMYIYVCEWSIYFIIVQLLVYVNFHSHGSDVNAIITDLLESFSDRYFFPCHRSYRDLLLSYQNNEVIPLNWSNSNITTVCQHNCGFKTFT